MTYGLEGFSKEQYQKNYSSDINQDAPIASSQVFELLLSFIDRVN